MYPVYGDLNRDTVDWCMAVWCTQKSLCGDGSNFHVTPATEHLNSAATLVDTQNVLYKAMVTHLEFNMTRMQWVCSEAGNSAIVTMVKCLGLISR